MQNQSLFVKIVIWLMIFLMSAGFAALVIAPFAGNLSILGGSNGRSATEKLVDSARADIRRDHCSDTTPKITGKRLARCQDALGRLASGYTTLASPDENATTAPHDAQRNLSRAGEAYKAMYELDTSNDENAARYAGYLRDSGKSTQALTIWTTLVTAHPDNEDYLLQLAGSYEQTQALDKAIATYRTFLKKFPDSGQIDAIKEQIKTDQEQQKQAAAGGANPAGAGGAPITVG